MVPRPLWVSQEQMYGHHQSPNESNSATESPWFASCKSFHIVDASVWSKRYEEEGEEQGIRKKITLPSVIA